MLYIVVSVASGRVRSGELIRSSLQISEITRGISAVVLLFGFTFGGCAAQDSNSANASYTWRNVKIVAGGFITGIVMHPAESGLMYTRTDIGGAYRWDAASKRWIPLNDWVSPADWNLLGVESIGLDPTNPDRLYLALGTYTQSWAGNGAIVRSTDRGATFQRTNVPFKLGGNEDGRHAGERLAVDPLNPARLYFGSRNNGLWTSTDYAETWKQVSSFPANASTNGIGIAAVVFDTITPGSGKDITYVAVSSPTTGLYRSTDDGVSWQAVAGQPTGLLPNHAVLSANGTLYLTYGNQPGPNGMTGGGVWKYNPKDGAWTNITPNPSGGAITWGFGAVAVDAANPDTVMVSTMDRWGPVDDLFRSTDAGATWKSTSARSQFDLSLSPWVTFGNQWKFGWWMGALALDPFSPGHVLYGTGATIYATDDVTNIDNGSTAHWYIGADGVEETAVIQLSSPPAGPELFSALGDIGGFAHDDLSISPKAGMYNNPVFSTTSGIDYAELNPAFVVRTGSSSGRKGAYSSDGGHTWKPFVTDAPTVTNGGKGIAVSADGKTIVWSNESSALFYSTDLGKTWTACTGVSSTSLIAADRVNPNKFYAYNPTSGIFYVSTDGAVSFTQGARIVPAASGSIRAVPGREGDIWMAVRTSGLRHSTDSGATFTSVSGIADAIAIGSGKAAADNAYPSLFLIGVANGVSAIHRSIDGGATWTRINDDAHQYGAPSVIAGDPRVFGRVYIGTNGRGIIYGDLVLPPKITEVVNGASFTSPIQPGSWITIKGENLAPTAKDWSDASFADDRLPQYIAGVRVLVNNKPAAIYYVSPTQINALAPDDDTTGPVNVVVQTDGSTSVSATAQLSKLAPSLFLFDPQGRRYAAAVLGDRTLIGPSDLFAGAAFTRPVKPGETVQVFGTACGPTDPPVDASRVLTGAHKLAGKTTASIGGTTAGVAFAGMTSAGLCQFNVVVPTVPDGDQPLRITIDGTTSPDGVFLSVKQ